MSLTAYKVWSYLKGLDGYYYEEFKKDVEENGYLCGECGERFHGYNQPIVCTDCLERLLINYDVYKNHLYLHGVPIHQYGGKKEDRVVAVIALFNDGDIVKIGATTNFYNWLGQAAKEFTFDHAAVLVAGDHENTKEEVKQLISLFAPEHNKTFKNYHVTEEVQALYDLMQRDLDRFLRRGLTKAGVKRLLLGSIPTATRKAVYEAYDHSCVVPGCDKEITKNNPLSLDHIIPVSMGGTHDFENLQPMCRSHNSTKSNREQVDYRQDWLARRQVAS